ncbi:hypothetical protein SMA5143A_2629 [Streptomyces sp. MA5143a]|nr:hypothetical protein SMA5143A_2629 [Streptomyces sp. MA5143a]
MEVPLGTARASAWSPDIRFVIICRLSGFPGMQRRWSKRTTAEPALGLGALRAQGRRHREGRGPPGPSPPGRYQAAQPQASILPTDPDFETTPWSPPATRACGYDPLRFFTWRVLLSLQLTGPSKSPIVAGQQHSPSIRSKLGQPHSRKCEASTRSTPFSPSSRDSRRGRSPSSPRTWTTWNSWFRLDRRQEGMTRRLVSVLVSFTPGRRRLKLPPARRNGEPDRSLRSGRHVLVAVSVELISNI